MNLAPSMVVLSRCSWDNMDIEEAMMIAAIRSTGASLINVGDGNVCGYSNAMLPPLPPEKPHRNRRVASDRVYIPRRLRNADREALFTGNNREYKRAKRDLRRHKYAMRNEE